MWVVSPRCALLSIVLADAPNTGSPSRNLLMIGVRARRKAHLNLLKKQHPVPEKSKILASMPGLDYPSRLVVDRPMLVQVFAEMAAAICWRNAKGEAVRNGVELGGSLR